jgi:hypothetical protein
MQSRGRGTLANLGSGARRAQPPADDADMGSASRVGACESRRSGCRANAMAKQEKREPTAETVETTSRTGKTRGVRPANPAANTRNPAVKHGRKQAQSGAAKPKTPIRGGAAPDADNAAAT